MTRLNDYAAGRYKQLRARKGERVSSSPSFCYTRSMKQCLGLPASSSDGHSTPPPPSQRWSPARSSAQPRVRSFGPTRRGPGDVEPCVRRSSQEGGKVFRSPGFAYRVSQTLLYMHDVMPAIGRSELVKCCRAEKQSGEREVVTRMKAVILASPAGQTSSARRRGASRGALASLNLTACGLKPPPLREYVPRWDWRANTLQPQRPLPRTPRKAQPDDSLSLSLSLSRA